MKVHLNKLSKIQYKSQHFVPFSLFADLVRRLSTKKMIEQGLQVFMMHLRIIIKMKEDLANQHNIGFVAGKH